MPQWWLRLVGLLTLATFLAANGPVNASALACLLAAPPSCPGTPGPIRCGGCHMEKGYDCEACCPCCHHEEASDEASDEGPAADCDAIETAVDSAGVEQPCPSCPRCPFCPGCPSGCCWCCAAKLPCCLSAPADLETSPCLGESLADHSLS